jgi:predicted regulator of Ras-like GTPase activity (Roadblock/LC7/MglB family)
MPGTATSAPTAAGPVPRNGTSRVNSAAPVSPVTPAAHPTILPEHTQSTISAPLAALSEEWPEALRQEIAQTILANAQVALPVHLVEPALKRGRVIFSWRYVRSWIRPVPPGVSVHDGIELELPLKVIAPLFFGQQKNVARLQRKITLTPEIPDLFFGFPQPQSPPEASVLQPELAAPKPETIRYAPKPADVKLADTNYYIWGDNGDTPKVNEDEIKCPATPPTDFTSRRAMPKDVIARALELPGVAGALVALQDGLKVASQVPADLNADTLAAFLPQIFDRLGQSTRELRMGALNNVNFTVGNVPWKIYRVNSVYFAAFGHAGEVLPTAQLALLAAELDRKRQ